MLRAPAAVTLTACAIALLSGCGGTGQSSTGAQRSRSARTAHVAPLLPPALPAAGAGCHGVARVRGGARRIPATISNRKGQIVVVINVCIEGHGPYPFVVDTGASQTAVDAALARRLRLPASGRPQQFAGAGCVATGREHRVKRWNLAGLQLHSQTVAVTDIPHMGGPGEPAGVVGSDVWNRFGQLRIDFAHSDLVVPGSEHPPPADRSLITTPASSPLPASLIGGPARVVAPMTVARSPDAVVLLVSVAFGSHQAREFLVDSGAAISVAAPEVATMAGLKRADRSTTQSTLCSVIVAPEAASGSWSIVGSVHQPGSQARQALVPQRIAMTALPDHLSGLLGSDQMRRFGSVVLDYAGGRILLGAH